MSPDRLSKKELETTLYQALASGFIREEDTAVIFYDIDLLFSRLEYLSSSFPPGTLHGLAIKANPLAKLLKAIHKRFPETGVEAASMGEVTQALRSGFPPARIVYDSPVKTVSDLEDSLVRGIHINADNLEELGRISLLAGKYPELARKFSVGLRINPQVGVGAILESSVAGAYSKFGVPVTVRQSEIRTAFLTYPWLTGVHLHVGSQGCQPEMLADGIRRLYDLVNMLQPLRKDAGLPPITTFDIGGGLPISYLESQPAPDMREYVKMIMAVAPELFPDFNSNLPEVVPGHHYRIITEFGRWVFTNPGWTVSRVEYVKHDPGINTAMLHVGADLFVRECLNPADWKHEYSVFNAAGKLKEGYDPVPWNLAGPLCFSGDIIAKNVMLPPVEPGDYIAIHDTGGYTFSMWSRYNSRQTPRILGYRDSQFEILKERESLDELLRFWD